MDVPLFICIDVFMLFQIRTHKRIPNICREGSIIAMDSREVIIKNTMILGTDITSFGIQDQSNSCGVGTGQSKIDTLPGPLGPFG
jgi:hypothetical protein